MLNYMILLNWKGILKCAPASGKNVEVSRLKICTSRRLPTDVRKKVI